MGGSSEVDSWSGSTSDRMAKELDVGSGCDRWVVIGGVRTVWRP